MTSVDTDHRRLCHTLFDAIEQGDIAAVEGCYAPEMTMWFNVTGQTTTLEEDLHRRRTYNDRVIHTFDDGFVAQYSLNVVARDSTKVTLWACLVGEVHDGRIVKLMEYLDAGKFKPRRGEAAAP
jgi:ketosteroid isomerase-like protein